MEKLELHKKLIAESLENWNGLKKASIDHFAQTGKASGSFFLALMEYAESYHNEMQVASHPTLPSDEEIRSVRNTFVTPQEKLAFNSGLNIASARIAEMENVSLKERLFKLANDFAVAKQGDIAVKLHEIHNSITTTPWNKN